MAEKMAVYKCELCGNIVEVLTAGSAALSCCGQEMVKQAENTTDAAVEKHVPVLEQKDGGWQVSVGSVDHPMTDDHYIDPQGWHKDTCNHLTRCVKMSFDKFIGRILVYGIS